MTVARLIMNNMDSLTKSERRVAHAILAQYPIAGLETLAKLGKRAQVSDPTVLRFISRIGYKKFNDFQNTLRDEVNAQMQSPITITPASIKENENIQDDKYNIFASTLAGNLQDTINAIPRFEIDKINQLFKDTSRRIFILGGEYTSAIALHLYFQLRKMRKGIEYIDGQAPSRISYLLDITKKDILFVFDVRRYQNDIINFASLVSERGCNIILTTDQWLSPIAKFATHVLPCKIDSHSRWDSLVAMTSVIELLVYVYMEDEWGTVRSRLEKLDDYKEHIDPKNQ